MAQLTFLYSQPTNAFQIHLKRTQVAGEAQRLATTSGYRRSFTGFLKMFKLGMFKPR
jgi:hypothetical protein